MLILHNNLTKENERFKSQEYGRVRMFTCGPSVYQRPHIGNYRTFLFEDILQRYLEYLGYSVIRTLNITDIEDKSISEAEKKGVSLSEITGKYVKLFFDELKLLKIKSPTYTPKSSESVYHAVDIIKELLAKGYAYWYRGNVYFDMLKFRDFGKLGKPDMSRIFRKKRRFHRDTYPGDYWNVGDFILWHGYKKGDTVYFDADIGRGRPAWNVQDPAMIIQTLGYSIDICCGGEDNLIRHHDYTIAVLESVSGTELAHYWLHGGHLLVNGIKMSKSKGNVIYIGELLDAGHTEEEIRFFLIYGNYSKRLNFTYDRIGKTSGKLKETFGFINSIRRADAQESDDSVEVLTEGLKTGFEKNMDNNLDVKQAFNDIAGTLSRLSRLAGNNGITSKDAGRIMEVLTGIDHVLRVFELAGNLNYQSFFHQVHGQHKKHQ
ncbi:MAG: class I tRNA ligase family protein [Candidatus Methanoperedenaceae archaeon]|nr:class I tRNA ligase family protein [Candidatus Methanoperedenaceae archaeon]